MEGVHGVRRGEVHAGAGVENQHTVAHRRRFARNHLVDRVRELALRQHPGQAIEDLDVHPLELSGSATYRQGRLSGHQGNQPALPSHRDADQPGVLAAARNDHLALDHAPQMPGPGQQGPVLRGEDPAHQVLQVQGLAGGRANLAQDDEALHRSLDRDEQEEIREAQVGQHAPPGDQALQVSHHRTVQFGVFRHQFGQRGHRGSTPRSAPAAKQVTRERRRRRRGHHGRR